MRIVMPLFRFDYEDNEEFVFDNNIYSLRKFISKDEIPTVPLFSKSAIDSMELESWAIVAENPDLDKYIEEVNMLLLAFKIFKSSDLFIRYRLCKEDDRQCHIIYDQMYNVLPEIDNKVITPSDLKIVNNGFSSLLEMNTISNRTHNALYFLYLGFTTMHWIASFMFIMSALESLFSKEEKGAAVNTICSRVSAFLNPLPKSKYSDIDSLYDIRSRMVHGNIKVDDSPENDNLEKLSHLQYIVIECMKKMLNERIYLNYADVKEKESYMDKLEKTAGEK